MIHAYNELYLDKARTSMARMLDFAVRDLRQDASGFFDLFVSSGTASLFEQGDVRVIAGMSGAELAYRVLEVSGIPAERVSYRYTAGRSREHWAGWALAYYQWETAIPFAQITASMPMTDILAVCDDIREREIESIRAGLSWMDTLTVPDHMNEENYAGFRNIISERLSRSSGPGAGTDSIPPLKRLRLQNGFSQSGLAAVSGVPVRTIQQYEQRRKDINKAGFDQIIKLAAALSCEPYNLLDR